MQKPIFISMNEKLPELNTLVQVKGDYYGGVYFCNAQRIMYKKCPKKKWRWCDYLGNKLDDQAFDAWREIK